MNNGENIFDLLEQHAVPYHVSNWRDGETDNLRACEKAMAEEDIRLAFLYMASMDGLLHQVGKAVVRWIQNSTGTSSSFAGPCP